MKPSEIHELWQGLRKKLRVEKDFKVEDSKRFLKQAILTRGGERLREEIQLAPEQQQLKEEERAFSEMLERNNEDSDSAGG